VPGGSGASGGIHHGVSTRRYHRSTAEGRISRLSANGLRRGAQRWSGGLEVWVAHTSRVLTIASRDRHFLLRQSGEHSSWKKKTVSARRRNQHARRVCYPIILVVRAADDLCPPPTSLLRSIL